jgi:hypothetical protein
MSRTSQGGPTAEGGPKSQEPCTDAHIIAVTRTLACLPGPSHIFVPSPVPLSQPSAEDVGRSSPPQFPPVFSGAFQLC